MDQKGVYLKLLYFVGVHPHHPLKIPLIFLNYIIIFCMTVLVILQIYIHGDLECVEALSSFFLVHVKYATLIFKRKGIINAIKETKHFWKIDEVMDETAFFYIQYQKKIELLCTVLMSVAMVVFLTKPFILHGTSSIFNCYIPTWMPFFSLYLPEVYFSMVLAFAYTSFNILISKLILLATAQFRLLNLSIKSIDYNGASNDVVIFRKCITDIGNSVKRHHFLIRFVEELNDILSVSVAFAMVCSTSLLCLNMYVLSSTNSTPADRYRAIINCVSVPIEFYLVFGYPLQLLMDEAADTANIIYYELPWYLPNLTPLRKYFILIIMRSQKEISIRAANYHPINNKTILMMAKTAYSFLTFLQTVEDQP